MKSTLILIVITFTFSLAAQHSYIPSVKNFTTKDGLSSNIIHAIHKDSRGFIWIGTEYGLNRYDGQEFDFFSKENQEHMTVDAVHKIASDGQGHLWILKSREKYDYDYTSCELNIFDTYSSKAIALHDYFKDELPFESKDIIFLQELNGQSIFIQVNGETEAFIYTRNEGFKRFKFPKTIDFFRSILQLPNGELLISGFDMLQKGYFYRLAKDGKILETLNPYLRLDITSGTSTQTYNAHGFWALPTHEHLKKHPRLTENYPAEKVIQSAFNSEEQLFWLRLDDKMLVINTDNELIFKLPYQAIEQNISALPILFDDNKTWFSDGQNGIQVTTLQANHFKNKIPLNASLSNSMRGILKDKSGNIWFSAGPFAGKFDKNNQRELLNERGDFTGFLEDKAGNIWWELNDLLSKFNPKDKSIQSYPTNTSDFTWTLTEMNNGEIWMSAGIKITAFNPETETFREAVDFTNDKYSIYDCYIYNIQEDINDFKKIWICTNRGLFLCNQDGKILALYNDKQEQNYYLPATNFHHLYQEKGGKIWLATGNGGLLQLTIANEQWTINNHHQYTISSGLSSNAVHSVYEDDYGYLWLSSDNGLMQFDKENEQVTKYFMSNGTVDNEFNRTSHFQDKNGTFYFGTINGWTSFHPKNYADAKDKQKAPQLTFKTFQQFSNRESSLVDLTEELLKTPTITLRPGDRFFNIHLALLDFYNGKNSTFSYRVKGIYDWQSSKNPMLNFSSLPYGSHTLEIKAQNGNGQQSANTLTFNIRVLRPFYLKWWFLLLVLAILGTSAFYFIKWRTEQLLIAQETAQLRQMDGMKSRFFANISHELRTPITLILSPLSQILKNIHHQSTHETERQLLNIQKNGKNLLTLVNEVLDLSKLEANKLELFTEPTEIPSFIQRLIANFESAAKIKNIDLEFTSTLSAPIVIELDQQKFEKIINNLLSNALKFTPKNGIIQIHLAQVDQSLIFKIKDNGRGIPQEDIPHIFDRYFQSKSNTTLEGGTGIGLALTKELVELMAGQIKVESRVGEGTEFEIELPVVSCQLPVVDAELTQKTNLRGFQNLLGLEPQKASKEKDTILLVEDNPSLQQFIQSILAPHYNVIVTGNGVEALEQLATGNPQLVLSDVMMPEMDGFTLLEKVKAHDTYCSIPFILLTARADIQDKLHGLRIGVDDYMTKPFEVEELLLRIRNLIANSKNRIIVEDEPTKETTTIEVVEPKPKPTISSKDLQWLEEIEAIILKNLTRKPFNLSDLSSELYMSQRQMSRKIKSITGLTPNRYIRSIRLHKAKVLLETKDFTTLSEISFAVGMENTTHFSQLFEEEFGKRPHEYLM